MKKPDFSDYWIIFLVCCLCIFFILGCAKLSKEEDPILEKLIELNIVDVKE